MRISLLINFASIFICCYASYSGETLHNKPAKRSASESSFSYAATDIGSKSGTRIKTITVIKNIGHKKDLPLKIDPELHKDDDWGSMFRDNFDAFGKIPDLPEIFNKKEEESIEVAAAPVEEEEPKMTEPKKEIPIYEEPQENPVEEPTMMMMEAKSEEKSEEKSEAPQENEPEQSSRIIEKLPDDIELIDVGPISLKQAELSARSQSLRFSNQRRENEKEFAKIFEIPREIKQSNAKKSQSEPYVFEQPRFAAMSERSPVANKKYHQKHTYSAEESNSKSVYTNNPNSKYVSKQYNSPSTTASTPYLAPSKKQLQLLKKLKQPVIPSTSAAPYIAPSVRKTYSATSMPLSGQKSTLSNMRTLGEFNPYQVPRSRGLRY